MDNMGIYVLFGQKVEQNVAERKSAGHLSCPALFLPDETKSVLRALSPDLFPFSWSVFVTFRKTGTVSSSIYIEKAMENKLSICLIRKKESEHYKNLSFSI